MGIDRGDKGWGEGEDILWYHWFEFMWVKFLYIMYENCFGLRTQLIISLSPSIVGAHSSIYNIPGQGAYEISCFPFFFFYILNDTNYI